MAKRKIGFYYLFLKNGDLDLPVWSNLTRLLDFLIIQSRLNRKQDIPGEKNCFFRQLQFGRKWNTFETLFQKC